MNPLKRIFYVSQSTGRGWGVLKPRCKLIHQSSAFLIMPVIIVPEERCALLPSASGGPRFSIRGIRGVLASTASANGKVKADFNQMKYKNTTRQINSKPLSISNSPLL
ncbi:unnamed protein product [Arctogadus glacialis]